MVSNMPHLRDLSINCAGLALRCIVRPPRLARLDLHLDVSAEYLNLSWLHGQHHDQLDIALHLPTCSPEASQQAIAKLQRVRISKLHLVVSEFPQEAQRLWATYSTCDHFHLEFTRSCVLSDVIHALPLCSTVTLTDGFATKSLFPKPLVILWQALAGPGRLRICHHMKMRGVQVQDFSQSSLQTPGPWQLIVHSARSSIGLPPSRPTHAPATYYQQNAAADAAGWDSMLFQDSCSCVEMHHLWDKWGPRNV